MPASSLAHVAADAVAAVAADLADRLQVGQSVEEALDVAAAQRRRDESTVGPAAEELREHPQTVDLAADSRSAAASVARELFCCPPFGGLGQPGLADSGERQVPAMAEDREIPSVLGLFAPWVGQSPPDVLGESGPQRPHGLVAGDLGPVGGDRGDLSRRSPSQSTRSSTVGDLRSAPDALLNAEQHLDDHQHRQRPQVHLPGLGHARFPGSPPVGIHLGVGGQRCPPALVVGVAVAARAVGGPGARRHRQVGIGGKGRTLGSARNCSIDIGGRRRRNFLACGSHNTACRTVGTHRHPGTAHRVAGAGSAGSSFGSGDLALAHPQPGQAREAPMTHRETGLNGVLAPSTRHTVRPNNRCSAGNDSSRVRGSHPASSKNPRSSIAARRAAAPINTTPSNTCGNSPQSSSTATSFGQPPGGHRVTSACSRGLGTASTAARSRDVSGCR